MDTDESPLQAAVREAEEETGLNDTHPQLIIETHIHGDECRKGCDDHEWSLFYYQVSDDEKATLRIDASEGKEPVWLALDELPSRIKKMPAAMQYLFTNHSDEIEAAILKN